MSETTPLAASPARILTRPDGATIAYRSCPGRAPGVVFLGGFQSDMQGAKAQALESHCRRRGQAFVRFDYFGHGRSSGDFAAGTIGRWADDALAVLDGLTAGPQVLVGSSMGGWIMLLAALRRPERIRALLGIAAAPDFTETLIHAELSPGQRRILETEGSVELPGVYGEAPYRIGRGLIEDGRRHLLLGGPIALACPVRLLHGMKDPDVPWRTALRISERLDSDDVAVTLIKDGDHRLSRPADLDALCRVLDGLLDRA